MKNETKENESQKIPPIIHKRSGENTQKEQPRRTKTGRIPPLKIVDHRGESYEDFLAWLFQGQK